MSIEILRVYSVSMYYLRGVPDTNSDMYDQKYIIMSEMESTVNVTRGIERRRYAHTDANIPNKWMKGSNDDFKGQKKE